MSETVAKPPAAPTDKSKKKRRAPPVIWIGMNLGGWWRLLKTYRFRVHWKSYHKVAAVTAYAMFNSFYSRVQSLTHGRRQRNTKLVDDPIFVIGHWRTGTTLLHELMALDERHGFPTTYECLSPNHFLRSEWIMSRIMRFFTPRQRNMDNMPLGMERPQEEEFALCNLGLPSPYLMNAFPNEKPRDLEYLTLDGVPLAEQERWKRVYWDFLRDVTIKCGKRLVLKNPPNTARVSTLLEMFPRAKFVHIIRNPYAVFPSTRNLWRRFAEDNALQPPTCPHLDEYVLDSFTRMYEKYERDRPCIPPGQYSELRYEQMVTDPVGELRRVYEEISLGSFEPVGKAIEQYMASQSDYQTNRFKLSSADRDQINARWGKWIQRWGYEEPPTG